MTRRILRGSSFVGALLLLAVSLTAQTNPNLEMGLKPYGSFEGGAIDSVSLTNGNLTIRIPIFSYAQRGSIPGEIHLSYNNKSWFVNQTCFNSACTDQWKWNPLAQSGIFFNSDGGAKVVYGPLPGAPTTTLFTVYTSDGASHQMQPDNAGGYRSVDGTGIWYNGATGSQTPVIRMRDGSQPLLVDPNGNWVTSNSGGASSILNGYAAGISIDTLGRNLNQSGTSTTDYTGCIAPAAPTQISSAGIGSYPGPNGTSRMIKVCSATYSLATNFQQFDSNAGVPIQEGTYSATFIVSVVLYNGSSWSTSPAWGFDYVSRDGGDPSTVNYGDLTKITLPTGGTISYVWSTGSLCTSPLALTQVSRKVAGRSLDPQDGSGPKNWSYSGGLVTDPDGNQTVHTITDLGGCSFYETQTQWFQGSSTTGTLLKTVKTDYSSSQNPYWQFLFPAPQVNVFPIRITTIWPNGKTTKVETDYDANFHSVNSQTFSYGQVTAVREYDFGTSANTPGPLLRTTTNTYQSVVNSAYLTANLLDLVSTTTVTDGSGAQVGKTTYTYDGNTLQASGITTQHDNAKANATARGNPTSVCKWLNTTGGNLCTATRFYDTGLPSQVTDAAGNTTTRSYSSTYAGAYVTQTNLPDTTSPILTHHVITGAYDFNTGQLASSTDQNGQNSSFSYDPLGRITGATFPDGGQTTFNYADTALASFVERQQKITNSLTNIFRVTFDGLARRKQTQLTSDPQGTVLVDFAYDNMGRISSQSNPYRTTSESTYGITGYRYDALHRPTLVIPPDGTVSSNNIQTQYCGNSTLVTDQAGRWRRSISDGAGRLIEVDEPNSASAVVNVCPGTGEPIWATTYSYDAFDNLKSIVQGGSHQRTFSYDSLSRLLTATNPESGTIGYSYDANGNLLVKADARSISTIYTYDSLDRPLTKRFTDGTSTVYYLLDGALPSATGVSGSTGSVTISGSEQSFIPDCTRPPCARVYDHGTVTISVGGVSKSTTYGANSTATSLASILASAFNTDVASPVSATSSSGTINFASRLSGGSTNYSISASSVTSDPLDFPSGSFGTAKVGMSGGAGTCIGSGITLTAANGIGRRSAMCDAGGAEAWSFDPMGRPVSDQRTTNSITKIVGYSYNLDGSTAAVVYPSGRTITYAPNAAGRSVSAIDAAGGVNYATAASYAPQGSPSTLALGTTGSFAGIQLNENYNNRLQPIEIKGWSTAGVALDLVYNFLDANGHNNGNVVQVTNNRDSSRTQNFTYDQVNRIASVKTTATTGQNCWSYNYGIDQWSNLYSAQPVAGYNCVQTTLSLTINTKNQITNTGFSYDLAGNTLGDGLNSYAWDAENRLKSAAGVNHTYDGDGKRIQKSSGKLYWYGLHTDALLETDLAGNPTNEYVFFNGKRIARRDSSANVFYYLGDHLGTSRVVTTSAGVNCYEADYQPYGSEAVTITNTCPQNYKFTGKERDSESGLDDFGARYYSSATGRFESTDPVLVTPDRFNDPQQFNQYAYVRNTPTRLVDPTGKILQLTGDAAQTKNDLCQIVGQDNCSRITVDDKTGVVTFDTKDLDLSKNEGAALVSDLVNSKNTYEFSEGPTVQTDKGPRKIIHIIENLPSFGDQPQIGKPRTGVSDVVALYFNNPNVTRVSNTDLKVALNFTVAFHELAEAYEKIDGGKGASYEAGHNAALQREEKLRDQRPYLKEYNHGAGGPANAAKPEGGIIVKQ